MRRLIALAALTVACGAHSTAQPTTATPSTTVTPSTTASDADPSPQKQQYKNVPPYQLDQAKISGDSPRLPDNVKLRYAMAGKSEAAGMYKICVAPTGDVYQVLTIASVPGGDDAVTSVLRTWKFKPQETGICSVSRFIWTIRR